MQRGLTARCANGRGSRPLALQKRVSTSGERDELFAGAANDLDRASSDQRQKLLDNNARLDNSTKRLVETQQLALQTGAPEGRSGSYHVPLGGKNR